MTGGNKQRPVGRVTPDDERLAVTLTVGELRRLVTAAALDAVAGRSSVTLLVDKQDMARQLGCSASHIDHLRKKGLPSVQVGQVVRFEPAKVLDWLRERNGPH